jgi:hypothetical protein
MQQSDTDNSINDRKKFRKMVFADDTPFYSLPRAYQVLIETIPIDRWCTLSDETIDKLLRGEMDGPELRKTLQRCGLTQARIQEILQMTSPMNALIEKMKSDLRSGDQQGLDAYRNQYASSGSWSTSQLQQAFEEASTTVANETQRKEAVQAKQTEQANAEFSAAINSQLSRGKRQSVAPMPEAHREVGNSIREMLAEKQHKFSA